MDPFSLNVAYTHAVCCGDEDPVLSVDQSWVDVVETQGLLVKRAASNSPLVLKLELLLQGMLQMLVICAESHWEASGRPKANHAQYHNLLMNAFR